MKFVSMMAAAVLAMVLAVPAQAKGKTFKDRDWSVSVYDNCGLPVSSGPNKSVSWAKIGGDKKLRFVLRPGEVGKCSTDNKARHRAPFWERAEVHQKGVLKLGQAHRVEVEFTVLAGFKGDRETFFQIHGWNGNCHAYPSMMIMFDKGSLHVWALRGVDPNSSKGTGQLRSVQKRNVSVGSLTGKANRLTIDFDARTAPGRLSVSLNGAPFVVNAPIEFASCAKPHVKMGIYRPGGKGSGTSEVLFDDLTVTRISP